LKNDGVIIQLADCSNAYPKGVLEDVLVQVDFDGEVINFNISETMRYPSDDHSCFSNDLVDSLAQEYFEDFGDDALETFITKGVKLKDKKVENMHTHGKHENALAMGF